MDDARKRPKRVSTFEGFMNPRATFSKDPVLDIQEGAELLRGLDEPVKTQPEKQADTHVNTQAETHPEEQAETQAETQAEKAGRVLEPFGENPKMRQVFKEIMAERAPKLLPPIRRSPSNSNFMERTLVFISHANTDAPLARKLVTLLCAALGCKKSDVRCTSVSGSRLPVGVDTANHLANDIICSPVFIGLLTEVSVQSAYVLFELGASWIMDYSKDGHRTFPVLGGDVSYDILPGPFKTRHAIRTTSRSDIQQMVDEIGTSLKLPLLAPNYYEDELDELVKYRPPVCTT